MIPNSLKVLRGYLAIFIIVAIILFIIYIETYQPPGGSTFTMFASPPFSFLLVISWIKVFPYIIFLRFLSSFISDFKKETLGVIYKKALKQALFVFGGANVIIFLFRAMPVPYPYAYLVALPNFMVPNILVPSLLMYVFLEIKIRLVNRNRVAV
ncbi:MAG: hypothetical protein COV29_04370 [Candidatus Yanofskybacteria bacterium CG10_big_fil_rev_8_21_14_0_10_36_16]|uniref:Uncharacterized protein n=1 Tax=Candidatus Yanofskybacteria bacterium CG10_big_fil_rev_8_21_14_0_10_36_16 TaxID=1975096 RepID=A0A2J0Q6F1_9BACT|nr:MAG: hypothetical protein COV29_04370 [Candidatus Yanofskybacteria bacterium CG10_big_fil_rev_8_21_14_0_10_36_16]